MSKEVMQMALDALDDAQAYTSCESFSPSMTRECAEVAEILRVVLLQPEQMIRSLTDELMDCVDRLGSESDTVDPRVWEHLLVYAPKQHKALAQPEQMINGLTEEETNQTMSVKGIAQQNSASNISSNLEPVAFSVTYHNVHCNNIFSSRALAESEMKRLNELEAAKRSIVPLYTAPQQRKEWVGLTEEDIAKNIYAEGKFMLPYSFASSIEAMLKEKNT